MMRGFCAAVWLSGFLLCCGESQASARISLSDCYQTKDIERTISGCTLVIEKNAPAKARSRAYFRRGVAFVKKQDHLRAIADFEHAVKLDKKIAAIGYYAISKEYTKLMRLQDAMIYIDAAHYADRNNKLFIADRSELSMMSGYYGAAISDIEDILEDQPELSGAVRSLQLLSTLIHTSSNGSSSLPIAPASKTFPEIVRPIPGAESESEITAKGIIEKIRMPKHTRKSITTLASDQEEQTMRSFGEILDKLPLASSKLEAPKSMQIGETRIVEVIIGFQVQSDKLQDANSESMQSIEKLLHITSEMSANLSGPGFKITAKTPEVLNVVKGFPTTWMWEIEAEEAGDRELVAMLFVKAPLGDKKYPLQIESYKQTISVHVKELTWSEWIKSFSDGLTAVQATLASIGTIGAIVVAWYSRSWLNKEKKSGG